jgi:cytochrome c-type biogenesis protein CcmH/NrfG
VRRWPIVLVLALPALAAEDPVATALAEARALLDQDKAQAALERVMALDATDPRVRLVAGVAQYHAGDAPAAIATLTPLVASLATGSPERREAVQVLGLSNYLAGHLIAARPLLEETAVWARDNLELNQILGNVYIETQKPDGARECFARAYGVAPDSAAAHLLAAQMMIRVEQEAMAEAELKQALAKDPKLPQVHFLLGQQALFRGRLEEALNLTRQELAVNPANGMAWAQLGDAYSRQLHWDEATAALQKSIWINPYYSAPYILLGRAYMKKNQPATAEGMLRRAISYDPNNKSAHYLLGQVLQRLGRDDDARREMETAATLQDQVER